MVERAAVLVPVKAFAAAKRRLAPALDQPSRAVLARRTATTVIAAAHPLPAAVVCDDDEVAAWARTVGAQVIWRPGTGLDAAVSEGVAELADQGFSRVVVAHADLPFAERLAWVAGHDGVTIVPDRRHEGTNVISLPTTVGFRFRYGVGSFARHVAEARRLGLALRVFGHPRLSWDLDIPADLDWPPGLALPPAELPSAELPSAELPQASATSGRGIGENPRR